MLTYAARRLGAMVIMMILVSIVSFIIIQLPPGDFLTTHGRGPRAARAATVDQASSTRCGSSYGLDQPIYVQYWQVDHAASCCTAISASRFEWNQPVSDLIWDRLRLTLMLSVVDAAVHLGRSRFPIGIYSAVRQYSLGDYVFTFIGFLGLAVPELPARAGADVRRLPVFRAERRRAVLAGLRRTRPGAWAEARRPARAPLDPGHRPRHWPAPPSLIRIMRANLLDELHKPYVVTARAKGHAEVQAAAEISGARGAQPVRHDGRLGAAAARLGRDDRRRSC